MPKPAIWKSAGLLFVAQFLNYGISTLSWRAVAQANIPASVMTDVSLGIVQFLIIREIAKREDTDGKTAWGLLGYTIGGALGTVTGIYASLLLLGK